MSDHEEAKNPTEAIALPKGEHNTTQTRSISKLPAWAQATKVADLRAQPWKHLSRQEEAEFDDGQDEVVIHKSGVKENEMTFSSTLAG